MKKGCGFLVAFLVCNFYWVTSNAASLRIADILQSKMVVQQNKPFKLWGQATRGQQIRITADWLSNPLTVTADDSGSFLAIISVPKVNPGNYTKHQIIVTSGEETITLSDLFIGEVWFFSGQSNMQMAMKEVVNSQAEVASSTNEHIRLFNTALNFSAEPINTIKGKWQECLPETVSGFPAVAYYFGKELHRKLDVPIGIIFSGIGASSAQAFTPRETLAGDSLLNEIYLQPYLKSPKSREIITSGFSFEKVTRPFLLYNGIINPFINLSIKGFCWYQGESNHLERESYTRVTQQMIKSWRERFGQGELPFYYVQIAPYFHNKEDPTLTYEAYFREAQEKISTLNNTGMVLTLDVTDPKDLHPKNKKPVGQRLAWAALNRTYGYLDIPYLGPHYQNVLFEQKNAIISFIQETVKKGLRTNDGKAPAFFSLAGKDQIFHPAEAKIVNDKIIVTSSAVKHPVAVRYAFFNYPKTNLENGDGLPAFAFRTDNWAEVNNHN